jgi:hypothetical protein
MSHQRSRRVSVSFHNKGRRMGESTKAVCGLLMIVGVIAAWLAWTADRPDETTWGFRIGGPIMAILALGLFLKLQFRADLEHDYLRPLTGTYFNRDGFCFAFVVTAVDGIAFMDAYFQTQYDRPSLGRIALRPAASGFFMTRAKIDSMTFEIECPPAGFGFARIAIPIPEKLQGKRQSFEVGASVRYPEGKGRRIRFHDGLFLRSNADFGNSFGTALTVVGAATGSIVLSKPATATIDLPSGVTEDIPYNLASETKILWQMGEPALENVV